MALWIVAAPVKQKSYSCWTGRVEAENEKEALDLGLKLLAEEGFTYGQGNPYQELNAWRAGLTKEWPIELDLDALAEKADVQLDYSNETGYCSSNFGKGKTYLDWENDVADPFLRSLGYKSEWCWVNGESDSFGPLSRYTTVSKDGLFYRVIYG